MNASNPFGPQPYEQPLQLTPEEQEAEVVAAVLDGSTPAEAGRAAGLSAPGAGRAVLARPHVRSALLEALEAKGLGDARIADVIDEGLRAEYPMVVQRDGSVVPARPDHSTRHKFLGTLLEVRGDTDRSAREEGDSWEAMILAVRARRAGAGGA